MHVSADGDTITWPSPDGRTVATWRFVGELWMSGPVWGRLSVGEGGEAWQAFPQALWSDDSRFLAFVALHGERGEPRVAIMRAGDRTVRFALGNLPAGGWLLSRFEAGCLDVSAGDDTRRVEVAAIDWER